MGRDRVLQSKLCVSQVSLGFSFPILPTPQCVCFPHHHYPMLRSQVCITIHNLFCFVFRHVCVCFGLKNNWEINQMFLLIAAFTLPLQDRKALCGGQG